MADFLHRERMMIGDAAVEKLQNARVMLFGVGGVGSYALEAIVRAGIGGVILVDCDTVSETNINRQIIADTTTVGRLKTEVAAERAHAINPSLTVVRHDVFAAPENIPALIDEAAPDYIIDAIDTVSAKLSIIETAINRGIPVISSMGTGAKLDPTRFRITDIAKTHTCPLAKVMRLKLRERGISHVDVLFSDELPVKTGAASELEGQTTRHIPGSISFVPSVAGLIIAGHVIKKIAELPV
ncbi:MAG: tRNA threonylcarbamoyladenosine dehydratase [Ruminococcaceae bacterium]|nr:tRNA threonylcarbamoyladenosine dehydratase [Oscillospiraceae bacterium]